MQGREDSIIGKIYSSVSKDFCLKGSMLPKLPGALFQKAIRQPDEWPLKNRRDAKWKLSF